MSSQASLCRFTKRPDAFKVNCSAVFSNTYFFVAFPPNKCLLSAYAVMRSLTSASSHLSRFTVVETSTVNEELQTNFSELFMQHFTRETCTGEKKASNKKNFYLPLICGTLADLALERGRQSTRSSPEILFAKTFQSMTGRKNRTLQVPPVVPYKALGNFAWDNGRYLQCTIFLSCHDRP